MEFFPQQQQAQAQEPGQHQHQQQGRDQQPSAATASALGPWVEGEPETFLKPSSGSCSPPTKTSPCRNWFAEGSGPSSSSILIEEGGSWCESVATPITRVRPARQVAPSCPPPEYKGLQDHGKAKEIALILCGSEAVGKLDPGASLQAVSILAKSPRTAGVCNIREPPATPGRGYATPYSRRPNLQNATERISSRGGRNNDKDGRIDRNRSSNNDNGEVWPGSNRRQTSSDLLRPAEERSLPETHSQLSDGSMTPQHYCRGSFDGSGYVDKQQQNRAAELNVGSRGLPTSSTSFVRSKQWGRGSLERVGSRRRTAESIGALDVCQLTVTGGKRARPLAAGEGPKMGCAASGRVSGTGDVVEVARSVEWVQRHGRDDRETARGREDNRRHRRRGNSIGSSTVVDGGVLGSVEGQDLWQGSPASLPESGSFLSLPETVAPSPGKLSAGASILDPHSDLRQDRDAQLLLRRGVPCWLETAAGAGRTPAIEHSRLSTTEEGGVLEMVNDTRPSAAVAAGAAKGVPAPAAASAAAAATAGSSARVPRPLSVVAVWARGSPPQTKAPQAQDSPLRAGIKYSTEFCCSGARVPGGRYNAGREKGRRFPPDSPRSAALAHRQSAAAEGVSMPSRDDPGTFQRRLFFLGEAPKVPTSCKPRDPRGETSRPRPASAGLLYFRAHLNRDGQPVAAASQGREKERYTGRQYSGGTDCGSIRLLSAGREKCTMLASSALGSRHHERTISRSAGPMNMPRRLLMDPIAAAATGAERDSKQGREGPLHGPGDDQNPTRAVLRARRPPDHPAVNRYFPHATAVAVRHEDDLAIGPAGRAAVAEPHAAIQAERQTLSNPALGKPPPDLSRPPRVAGTIATTADCTGLRVRGVGGEVQSRSSPSCLAPRTTSSHKANAAPTTMRSSSSSSSSSSKSSLGNARQQDRRQHYSSALETISGKEHFPRPCPPEYVSGIGITFPNRRGAQPAASPPRCARTTSDTKRCTFGDCEGGERGHSQGANSVPQAGVANDAPINGAGTLPSPVTFAVPIASAQSPRSALPATCTAGGGGISRAEAHARADASDDQGVAGEPRGLVGTPHVPLLRSRSCNTLADVKSGGRQRQAPFDSDRSGVVACNESPVPLSSDAISDFQLCVKDPSEDHPRHCTKLGVERSPKSGGARGIGFWSEGEAGRAKGGAILAIEDGSVICGTHLRGNPPDLTTPFSRYLHLKSSYVRKRQSSPEAGTSRPKKDSTTGSPRRHREAAVRKQPTPYEHSSHDSQAFLRGVLGGVSRKRVESKKNGPCAQVRNG